MRLHFGQLVDLTVGQYVDIRVLLVQKIQEIYAYALFVWWITSIYLYDHVCMHLTEVYVLYYIWKNESDKYNYAKIVHFITCSMPDLWM